jgi:hypothetical protein
MRLEGLCKSKKKINDLIGNRTRDLPACSIVLQPTTLSRVPMYIGLYMEGFKYNRYHMLCPKLVLLISTCCLRTGAEKNIWTEDGRNRGRCRTCSLRQVKLEWLKEDEIDRTCSKYAGA